jgi:hypothetical protein
LVIPAMLRPDGTVCMVMVPGNGSIFFIVGYQNGVGQQRVTEVLMSCFNTLAYSQ